MLLLYVGGRFGASYPAAMTRAVAGKTGQTTLTDGPTVRRSDGRSRHTGQLRFY